jgi:hypothetical protein
VRDPNKRPVWISWDGEEVNSHVRIGNADRMLGPDGLLMPSKNNN